MKRLLALTLALLALLSLAGCESILFPVPPEEASASPTVSASQEEGVTGTELHLDRDILADDGTTLVHYAVKLPQVEAVDTFAESINAYYRKEYSDFITTAESEMAAVAQANLESHDETGTQYTACEATQTYAVELDTDRYFSVSRQIQLSFGNTSVELYYKGDTFDRTEERQIRLGDLFTCDSGTYLERLCNEVRGQVEITVTQLPDSKFYDDYETLVQDFLLEDDFWLTDSGLMLFYPTGTLAPETAGIFTFLIPYANLDDILVEGLH